MVKAGGAQTKVIAHPHVEHRIGSAESEGRRVENGFVRLESYR